MPSTTIKTTSTTISAESLSAQNGTTVEVAKNRTTMPPRKLSLAILLLGLIALCVTGYLGWVAMNSSKVAGCGGGSIFDCNDVINSRWSRWLGIPVSFLAFGMYVSLIASVVVGSKTSTRIHTRKIAWGLSVVIGLSAGLAAIWFISLQFFVLKHLCTYCLAAHTCGLIISGFLLWFRPLGGKSLGLLSMISLLGFGVLAGGQLLVKPVTYKMIEHKVPAQKEAEVETFEFDPTIDAPTTESTGKKTSAARSSPKQAFQSASITNFQQALLSVVQANYLIAPQIGLLAFQDNGASTPQPATKPKERRFVSLSGGALKLDVSQWPLAGKPDAKYIFVEMYDYTCDHCRRTHAAIVGAKMALGGDVAVLALPIPLNTNCNNAITQTGPRMAEACEISMLAVAVWRVDPSKFDEFHNLLMSTPVVVTYAEATAKAIQLVDATKLNDVLASNVPSQYIAQHIELYKKVGTGNVPKLLFPTTSIVGEFTSPEALADVIKSQIK